MASIGAVLAALFMLATQGGALLIALRTGVLVSKSYGSPKIRRAEEEEKFWRFWKARARNLGVPAILLLVGVIWLIVNLRSIAAASA